MTSSHHTNFSHNTPYARHHSSVELNKLGTQGSLSYFCLSSFHTWFCPLFKCACLLIPIKAGYFKHKLDVSEGKETCTGVFREFMSQGQIQMDTAGTKMRFFANTDRVNYSILMCCQKLFCLIESLGFIQNESVLPSLCLVRDFSDTDIQIKVETSSCGNVVLICLEWILHSMYFRQNKASLFVFIAVVSYRR